MRAIDVKVLRDFRQMGSQLVAIALVIACGTGLFLGMRTVMTSLARAKAEYYAHERFADLFVGLVRAPEPVAEQLRAIPGVERLQTRVVADVSLDVPGLVETATGRLVSLPDAGVPAVNGMRLRSGRLPEPGHGDEVVVSEPFAIANSLSLGAELGAVIDGKHEQLQVVGTGLSPEFVFAVPPGSLLPDDRRFAVIWMRRATLGPAFDMDGAFNDVGIRVARDARPEAVAAAVDRVLDRYGGTGAVRRAEQPSNFFVESELQQLRTIGAAIPTVFLLVAAFLLHIVVGRIVAGQREQIAALKAVGYRDREVGAHYAKLVGLVVLLGLLLGIALARWVGGAMVEMYRDYYRFPDLRYSMDGGEVQNAVLITLAAAALGGWGAIRRTVRLPPAEAMRPEAPPVYRATLLERFGLAQLVPPAVRMVLRELERKPARALLSVLGIALATAIVVLTSFTFDSMHYVMVVQFGLTQREDVQLSLFEPRSLAAIGDVEHLPGVLHAEPFRTVPVRLRHGVRWRSTAITGLPAGVTMHGLLDRRLHDITLPSDGLVLSRKLAELLGVGVGDVVQVEVLERNRPICQAPVVRVTETFVGITADMALPALCRMIGETPSLNGAWLAVDDDRLPDLHRAVKATPQIAGVTSRNHALANMRDMLDENLGSSMAIQLSFSLVLALGVLYNTARITLAERARELASLRVLGFRRSEVTAILLGELVLLTAVALPLGVWMGYGMAAGLTASGFDTEQFRLPLMIYPSTYALAVLTISVAAVLSALAAWRGLEKINIVEVLKSRD